MDRLVLLNDALKKKLINKRATEIKFGEHVQILPCVSPIYEQLLNLDVKYVIFGIPEDIGVFANYGKNGASKAWEVTLKALLNIQSNTFTKAREVLILGHLDFGDLGEELQKLDQSKKKHVKRARQMVEIIDSYVSHLVYQIVSAGKTPIVIGGGHNNAYGNIKGTSLALNKSINVLNLDAHSDFRIEEGRHSGNGFTYAYGDGFLRRYFIFGLHENYTSNKILERLGKLKCVKWNTYDSIKVRKDSKFNVQLQKAEEFITDSFFGLEIDCDAILNTPSSAQSPTGFSVERTREFIHYFAKHQHVTYLHICEAAPSKKTADQVGKLLANFILDFIKA